MAKPATVKTVAYVVAAVRAGIAGALFVPIVGIISPNDVGIVPSIGLLIGVAIGGRATLLGPVLGTIAVAFLPGGLASLVPALRSWWKRPAASTRCPAWCRRPARCGGQAPS